jgi:hypothetical protein
MHWQYKSDTVIARSLRDVILALPWQFGQLTFMQKPPQVLKHILQKHLILGV